MMSQFNKVKIFISYATEDKKIVEELYQKLSDSGFSPWMAPKDILGGEDWQQSIKRAIKEANFFIICLSKNSVRKRGIIQEEIKEALDIWKQKLIDDIFLIPIMLEKCEMPGNLSKFQWVNLNDPDGFDRLKKSIEIGMQRSTSSSHEFNLQEHILNARTKEYNKANDHNDILGVFKPLESKKGIIDVLQEVLINLRKIYKKIKQWKYLISILIIFLIIVFSNFFETLYCLFRESEDFYLGYRHASIEILENSRATKLFMGKISSISPELYKKLKVVVYVYVENDVWNIHPVKNSYSEINSNGLWSIRWVQRVSGRRPDKVCALLVPKKCIKTPELIDDPSQIKNAVVSSIYTIIGDTAITRDN